MSIENCGWCGCVPDYVPKQDVYLCPKCPAGGPCVEEVWNPAQLSIAARLAAAKREGAREALRKAIDLQTGLSVSFRAQARVAHLLSTYGGDLNKFEKDLVYKNRREFELETPQEGTE